MRREAAAAVGSPGYSRSSHVRETVKDRLDPQALELWGLEPKERYTRRRRVILWGSVAAAAVGVIVIVQLTIAPCPN